MAELEKIPIGACILWDRVPDPPAGWDEVILGGRFVRIGAGLSFGGSSSQSHSHGVSASSGQETYSTLTGEHYTGSTSGTRNLAQKPHTHSTSGSASSYNSSWEPEHTTFRVFKNTDANRTEFPQYAIVFYDKAVMPPGWTSLGTTSYLKVDTSNLGVFQPFVPGGHTHSVSISLSANASPCYTDNEFADGSLYDDCNHNHSAYTNTSSAVVGSWTLNRVRIGLIKQSTVELDWDNDALAYLYCLFDATTSAAPFVDVTHLYTGRFVSGGGSAPVTASGNNGSHSHSMPGSLTSGYVNQLGYFGPGFPLGTNPPSNSVTVHTHPVTASISAGGGFAIPLYREFKLIRILAAGYRDVGIRYAKDGTVHGIGVEDVNSSHKIRIRASDGNTYGIPLLDASNPFAGHVKIWTGSAHKFLPTIVV